MPGCRKIFSNLLLLSVILFSLGGAVRPVVPGFEHCNCPCCWHAPEKKVDFQWEAAGSEIVYRHVHVANLLSGGWTELIAPEKTVELFSATAFQFFDECRDRSPGHDLSGVRVPRAPPVWA